MLPPSIALEMLIFRLELLKNTLQNHKLNVEPRKSVKRGDGSTGSCAADFFCENDGDTQSQTGGLRRSGQKIPVQSDQQYIVPQRLMFPGPVPQKVPEFGSRMKVWNSAHA